MPEIINGEEISDNELADLRRMVEHDAKEFAGVFFEEEPTRFGTHGRSKKFRKSWNEVGRLLNQDPCEVFVGLKWKHFVGHVRAWYGHRIPNESEEVQQRLFRACIIMASLSEMPEAQDVIQLEPDTKAFLGDKFENNSISETYGDEADAPLKTLLGSNAIN